MQHNVKCIVVDAYATGGDLVDELNKRGASCLHLRSTAIMPRLAADRFDEKRFEVDLGFIGGVEDALDTIRSLSPDYILAGSEWGVTYAEALAHSVGTPTNKFELISARRDKYQMIEAVRKCGLHVPRQRLVSDTREAIEIAGGLDSWPLVVKPLNSAAADGFFLCKSTREVKEAVSCVLGKHNILGFENERVLLQEHVNGDEFMVNTVSMGGKHHCTDIWQTKYKIGDTSQLSCCDARLVDPAMTQSQEIIGYVFQVLSALGIENTAAHTEIRISHYGPTLLECNVRTMGIVVDREAYAAAGIASHPTCYAQILTESLREGSGSALPRCYSLSNHAAMIGLGFERDGVVDSTDGLKLLSCLPSFFSHCRPLPIGQSVSKSTNTVASGGVVYLVHKVADQIEDDIRTIRNAEAEGRLYGISRRPLTNLPSQA